MPVCSEGSIGVNVAKPIDCGEAGAVPFGCTVLAELDRYRCAYRIGVCGDADSCRGGLVGLYGDPACALQLENLAGDSSSLFKSSCWRADPRIVELRRYL